MTEFTQKYVIVSLVEPLGNDTEFMMADWPLHVTVADVFAIDGSVNELIEQLKDLKQSGNSISSKIVGDEWFGEDKSIHVRLVEITDELKDLHQRVLDVLVRSSVVFNNPEYTGPGFRPHSTVQSEDELKIGDIVAFKSLTVIDMFPGDDPYKRKVLGTVSLL